MLTSFYLALLALVYVRISLDTIKVRRSQRISLGTGDNPKLLGLVSAHSNFQSYVPIIALLMFFYEGSDLAHPLIVHALGLTTLTGRILHYLGIKDTEKPNFKFRVAGMRMTIIPLLVLAVLNIANFAYVTRIKGS